MSQRQTPLLRSLGPWVLLGIVLGCGLAGALLIAARLTAAQAPPVSAGLTVIPLPTATMTPSPSPMPAPTAASTEQPIVTPSGGPVSTGMLVEIVGTGDDGLRLRAEPGLQSATNLVAVENEVFEVRDGPSEADGRTWWYLVNPYDNGKYGWGVADYLQPTGG